MRADHGRPDVLELFQEDAEVHFPKFGLGFGRNSILGMLKGLLGDGGRVRWVSGRPGDAPAYAGTDFIIYPLQVRKGIPCGLNLSLQARTFSRSV